MKKEDIPFLLQLVESLEEAEANLEQAHDVKDNVKFTNSKNMISKLQNKIAEIIR